MSPRFWDTMIAGVVTETVAEVVALTEGTWTRQGLQLSLSFPVEYCLTEF